MKNFGLLLKNDHYLVFGNEHVNLMTNEQAHPFHPAAIREKAWIKFSKQVETRFEHSQHLEFQMCENGYKAFKVVLRSNSIKKE
jgi:hypothetical protein